MEAEVFERLALQEADHWWFCGRRSILREMVRRHLGEGAPVRILEAGCGTGGNLAMLAEFGEVSAFEIELSACEIARAKGFMVEQGALPEAHPFTGEQYDLIILFDVLEHVEEDYKSLVALARLLKPGGHLIMTVPAFKFLWSFHDVQHHHFRRYRRPQLRRMLESSGLEVPMISYFNFWLFPVILFIRMMKNIRHSRKSDEQKMPLAPANELLKQIFSSERYILPHFRFPIGVSLMAVARKPG